MCALAVTRGRLNAVPVLLNDMPLERSGRIFLHPIHQDAFPALVQFIVDLRHCRTYPDYYRFQQELLGKVLEVQGHRAACSVQAGRSTAAGWPSDTFRRSRVALRRGYERPGVMGSRGRRLRAR